MMQHTDAIRQPHAKAKKKIKNQLLETARCLVVVVVICSSHYRIKDFMHGVMCFRRIFLPRVTISFGSLSLWFSVGVGSQEAQKKGNLATRESVAVEIVDSVEK
ncbi:hypothetical protein VNO77_25072 [Canavalia gladiata]|uniref:Uncharacterized protein n=1 Tax=Canavalia gladiata TaxID=3824 RepID=A0AAN9L8U4_CANGL